MAGLVSEALAAIDAIPGAQEAIFEVTVPPTNLFVRSADGIEWEQLDVPLPGEVAASFDVATSGDRLVVVGSPPASGAPNTMTDLEVAWTEDLVSWTTARLGLEQPADLPEGTPIEIWTADVPANAAGWIVGARTGVNFGDAAPPLEPSPELEPYVPADSRGFEAVTSYWYALLDGQPVITAPAGTDVTTANGSIIATDAGFVYVSGVVRATADGTTWEPSVAFDDAADIDPMTTFFQPVPDGFVISLSTFDGDVTVYRVDGDVTVYRVDATGSVWEPLDVPGLPAGLAMPQLPGGNGYFVETGIWTDEIGQWIVATPDGQRWFLDEYHGSDPEENGDGYGQCVVALDDGVLLVGAAELADDDWWTITF